VKIGSASAVALAGVMLTWAGFQSDLGPQNAQSALTALEMTFALIPAALGVIAAAIIWGHKLDADTHAEIRRRLALRDMDHEPPSAL
jgi:Na+/melibiose symporter-like transporter